MKKPKQYISYAVFLLMDYKPGCVDFLGTVEADNLTDAETEAEQLYLCREGEYFNIYDLRGGNNGKK